MDKFFCGWRRMLGCVTLVSAVVFMAGWVRSLTVYDRLFLHNGTRRADSIDSVDGQFAWGVRYFSSDQNASVTWKHDPFSAATLRDEIKIKWYGIGFCNELVEPNLKSRGVLWFVPYWSIVLPLTLFSAYLWLSKSSRHKKTSPLTATEEP